MKSIIKAKTMNHSIAAFLARCLALLVCGDMLAFEAYCKSKLQDESIIDVLFG